MSEAEVWQTAWLMTAFFGGAASAHRAALNHVRLVKGSPSGEESWQRVAGALHEIKTRRLTRAVH
ncbi:MAG: hypothetical protein JO256_02675 [Alphaproteobacteria bacterium]|nr:hypothetical protein [Alphaproteobacteria bacterium]